MRKEGKAMNENKEIGDILREILKWIKVTSIPKVKKLLLEILSSPEEKIAYQLSEGKKTVKQVAEQVNAATGTVSGWWKKWIKAGIADPIPVRGGTRARRVFLLDDFGIEVPAIEATAEKDKGED